MLEMTREYGQELLALCGEQDVARTAAQTASCRGLAGSRSNCATTQGQSSSNGWGRVRHVRGCFSSASQLACPFIATNRSLAHARFRRSDSLGGSFSSRLHT